MISEVYYFSGRYWRNLFEKSGWALIMHDLNRLFYTGNAVMSLRLNLAHRRLLSSILGSSGHIFVLRKGEDYSK